MEQNFPINIITPIVYNITLISRSMPICDIHSTKTDESVKTDYTQDVDTTCVQSTDITKVKID